MKNNFLSIFGLVLANAAFGQTPNFKTFSKFDFVSGEKIAVYEDFMQTKIGDFPAKWSSNGSGEIVNIDNNPRPWLQLNGNTKAFPDVVNSLPENFTLEFEIAANSDVTYLGRWLGIVFSPVSDLQKLYSFQRSSQVTVEFSPYFKTGESVVTVYDAAGKRLFSNRLRTTKFACPQKPSAKVSVWRQKSRLRVYLDEEKIWDVSNAFGEEVQYKKMGFMVNNLKTPQNLYVSGFRLAVGDPDTRHKLLSTGRFVTTGILFDSNSDDIKPESYGVLEQIAQLLRENPELKIRVIGHTDSDGEESKNLDLSKRRAAAIKTNLTLEFGIDTLRLQTDGKGEAQPTAPNATPEGKANNRRVEFVKL